MQAENNGKHFFHLYIASTLNDIYICRNLRICPWICSFNIHGHFMLVCREIASPKEYISFMCFIFWHSTCYLNLFLNVLNRRTNLPLGVVTTSSFLGAHKGVPLFTRQWRKWSLRKVAWYSLLLVPIDCTNRMQSQQHAGPDVPLILQLLLLISALTLYWIPFIDGRVESLLAAREPVAWEVLYMTLIDSWFGKPDGTQLSLKDFITSARDKGLAMESRLCIWDDLDMSRMNLMPMLIDFLLNLSKCDDAKVQIRFQSKESLYKKLTKKSLVQSSLHCPWKPCQLHSIWVGNDPRFLENVSYALTLPNGS